MKEKKNALTYQLLSRYRGVLMGISIINIILFHYLDDVRTGGAGLTNIQKLIFRYNSSSNVDIFILLSGLGLYFSMKKGPDLLQFYMRRFTRVLVPYVLVAVPVIYWRQIIFYQEGMKSFWEIFAVPLSTRWFWYIWLICFCYLIFPYVFDMFESAQNRIQEQMYLAVVFIVVILFAAFLRDKVPEVYNQYEVALLRVPWFFAGCMLGKASYEKREIRSGLLFFIIASILLVPLRNYKDGIVTRNIVAAFNLSLCFMLVIVLNGLEKTRGFRYLTQVFTAVTGFFGKYSLELYLTHVAIRRVFLEFKLPMHELKYEGLMVLLSLAVSLVLKPVSGFLEALILNPIRRKKSQEV